MKKKICAGKNGNVKAYFNIEINNENDKPVLSICGDIYEDRTLSSCGQCIHQIVSLFPTEKNKRIEKIEAIEVGDAKHTALAYVAANE